MRHPKPVIPAYLMNQDFAQLYSELGLRPGCSLVELKRAYRRRVAEQHPDRAVPQPASVPQNLPLPELISLYTAAIHFHRQYGRLPGGLHVHHATGVSSARTSGSRRVPPGAHPPSREQEPKLPVARTLIIAILLIALLLVLQTSWDRLASNVDDDFTRTPVGIVPEPVRAADQAATDDRQSRRAVVADTLSLGEPTQPSGRGTAAPVETSRVKQSQDAANAP